MSELLRSKRIHQCDEDRAPIILSDCGVSYGKWIVRCKCGHEIEVSYCPYCGVDFCRVGSNK